MLGLEESKNRGSAPQFDIDAVFVQYDFPSGNARQWVGAAEMEDGFLTSFFSHCHQRRDSDKEVDIILKAD